jgi:Mg2+/Co2+ transporter CorB
MPTKHRSILLNLFDLENITVDDVMIPRRRIEALDFDAPFDTIVHQLETCYHNKLVVYQGDIDRVLGVLHVRKTLSALHNQEFERETLRELLAEPYFVPAGTPVFQQLQFFQESRHRIAVVVTARAGDAGRHHRGIDRRVHHDHSARRRVSGRLERGRRMHRGGKHAAA